MSDRAIHDDRVFELAGAICNDCASENDVVELDSLVVADEESGRRYWDYCQMHVMLGMEASVQRALQKGCRCPRENLDLATLLPWEADALLATATPAASAMASPPLGIFRTSLDGTFGLFSSGWPAAYLTATLILGLGLFIGGLIRVSTSDYRNEQAAGPSADFPSPVHHSLPKAAVVGRITGLADCRWTQTSADGSQIPEIKNRRSLLCLGDTFTVSSGLMEITYDTGARVILQGPVTYEVESVAGGYLSVGKLTAKLEKKSEVRGQRSESVNRKSSDLFAIRTPTALITDLGTEFGVEVDKSGSTKSVVFRGSVQIQRTPHAGKTESPVQVLHQNQSAWVDSRVAGGITLLGPANKPTSFVRRIPTTTARALNLVDVVAGGDGLGKARDRGIDPTTGRTAAEQPSNQDLTGDGRYHRVAELPLVDGVFVPRGGKGPVQLDSAGHVFGEFPTTAKGTWGCIWAGGVLPNPGWPVMSARLQRGLDYSSPWHSVLGMHANKGITFDLDAIRQANTGYRVARFSAAAGRSVMIETNLGKCDIWVFVDGQPRFRREQITTNDGELSILVPLDGRNRFLTLVATDGGDGLALDTVVFGDPVLTLERCSDASERPIATSGESKHGDQ